MAPHRINKGTASGPFRATWARPEEKTALTDSRCEPVKRALGIASFRLDIDLTTKAALRGACFERRVLILSRLVPALLRPWWDVFSSRTSSLCREITKLETEAWGSRSCDLREARIRPDGRLMAAAFKPGSW